MVIYMKYKRLIHWFNKVRDIIETITKETNRAAISAFSGQSAFFLMRSFFPFFMFMFAVLKFTPFTESMFLNTLEVFIPDSFHNFLSAVISGIYSSQSATLLPATIITAIWLGSKAFLSLANGLNSVYEIEETRNYLLIRFYSAIYTIAFALLIIATLAFMVFGNRIYFYTCKYFPMLEKVFLPIINFRPLISFFIMFLFFIIMYKAIPDRKCSFKSQIPGAVIATTGWLVYSDLYSLYVDHFSNYSAFYGAMTVIALLMVWLYACMYILFFGGLVNKLLDDNGFFVK